MAHRSGRREKAASVNASKTGALVVVIVLFSMGRL
jgi:hypothetical protein